MSVSADSPFDSDRQPKMTLAASRRTKCRAASRPRPVLEPVIMIVWPVKEVEGTGRVVKSWERRKEVRKPAGLDVVSVQKLQ